MSEYPSSIPPSSRLHVYRADEPLLPAVEGHKPWLTTFKVPSHATASIRYGHISTVGTASSSTSFTRRAAQAGPTDDDRTRRKEREVKKRSEIVGRLTRAKESTLDYRLGITKNKAGMQARPNPVSVKGWAGLVEERIEVRCVPSMIMKIRPFPFPPSEQDKKDTSAPSRAAGSPLRGVTRNTTHSLLVKSFL
jgi:DnaJ family protein C protein 28